MKSTTTTRKSRSKTTTGRTDTDPFISHVDRTEHIAVSAYYKAQARGFAPGQELEDWLQAEAELATVSPQM